LGSHLTGMHAPDVAARPGDRNIDLIGGFRIGTRHDDREARLLIVIAAVPGYDRMRHRHGSLLFAGTNVNCSSLVLYAKPHERIYFEDAPAHPTKQLRPIFSDASNRHSIEASSYAGT
jgi:hypothetical protein